MQNQTLFLDHKNFSFPLQNNGKKCLPPLPRNFFWPFPSLSREVKKIPLRKTSKIFGIDITRIKGYSTRAASSPWADAFFFLSHLGGQNVIWIFSNLRVGVRIGSFCPKLRYITDQTGPKRGPHENEFDYFQIQKWMLQTVRVEKVDEKNGVIRLVPMFPSWVMILKLPKKVNCLQFCADLSKKTKPVKQFTYMHLKVIIILLQKMIWFVGAWATIHEILAIKISIKMLTQQKSNKILRLQTLIYPKQ